MIFEHFNKGNFTFHIRKHSSRIIDSKLGNLELKMEVANWTWEILRMLCDFQPKVKELSIQFVLRLADEAVVGECGRRGRHARRERGR